MKEKKSILRMSKIKVVKISKIEEKSTEDGGDPKRHSSGVADSGSGVEEHDGVGSGEQQCRNFRGRGLPIVGSKATSVDRSRRRAFLRHQVRPEWFACILGSLLIRK